MTAPAWDLDAPVEPQRPLTGFRPGPALLLAIGLAGLGLGGMAGSALAPAAAPRFPTTATLSVRDLYVDTSKPVTVAVAVFRLKVDNPAGDPVKVRTLELDGVNRSSNVLPLNLPVAAHGSAWADVTVNPDCSPEREPIGMRAWLHLTTGGSDPETVRIAPARILSRVGGLCSALDTELPNGWRTPLRANQTRLVGADLEVTLRDLSAARLVGVMVGGRLVPTVFLGDQLLSTTAKLEPGEPIRLLLRGPPPCIQFTGDTPIPSTVRLLAGGDQGIQQRLVVIGPALTRWLRLDCAR